MKNLNARLHKHALFSIVFLVVTAFACNNAQNESSKETAQDSVAANIEMYTHVWDEIINNRKLEMFNDSNFTKDVVMHASPSDVIGIDSARAYYANYLTGFSDVAFSIKDVFGMGNKLVKHWNFRGTHTGTFFGIPAGRRTDADARAADDQAWLETAGEEAKLKTQREDAETRRKSKMKRGSLFNSSRLRAFALSIGP